MTRPVDRLLLRRASALALTALVVASLAACSGKPKPVVVAPGAGAPAAASTTATVAGAVPAGAVSRYVANTGGVGVRYRVECQDGALYPGGFAEGDAVSVERTGTGSCAGWSVVTAGVARSWIRDEYLAEQPPVVVRAAPPQSGAPAAPAPVGAGGGTLPAFAATFQSPAGGTVLVAELNGEAIIQGGPAGLTYLGIVSSSRTAPDSICNPSGAYGSTTGPNSIRNSRGQFGTAPSEFSAYDPTAPEPPKIRMKNATVGYLSKGAVPGRGNVDPDFLFRALGC